MLLSQALLLAISIKLIASGTISRYYPIGVIKALEYRASDIQI
ncbi:hypothetical protein [Psychrobacter immobilis]|nr:hypothetical protein [Psychrobacter immobilis]